MRRRAQPSQTSGPATRPQTAFIIARVWWGVDAIYVLEGEITVYVGQDSFRIASGSFTFVPRGVAHTFAVETGSARLLTVSAPTGALLMFSEAEGALGTRGMPARLREADLERLDPGLRDWDLTIVAPHPRT